MQKEARSKAERVFLDAKGEISNVEIAKKVGAHPITVGKWKKQDGWVGKLAAGETKPPQKREAKPVRKKTAHEEALASYLKAGGKISNKALADKVGVSATTISNWKNAEGWGAKLQPLPTPKVAVLQKKEAPAKLPPSPKAPAIEEIEIDVDKLAAPDQLTSLNKQIDEILGRGHLSPTDLKIMAEAKEAALRAVMAYLEVMDMTSEE